MKKILFIDAREGGDWGMDLLFAGITLLYGYKNNIECVIDYPTHKKHRDLPKLVGDCEKDWGAERRSLGYTKFSSKLLSYNEEAIFTELKRGNIELIVLDERHQSYELYKMLRCNMFNVPVIVVAGHDRFWNNSPQFVKENYYKDKLKAMFIDNWKEEYNCLSYAKHYSWASNFEHLYNANSINEKLSAGPLYDISFMGFNSHPNRFYYINHIMNKWGHLNNNIVLECRPNSFDCYVNKEKYFETMLRSKICLNLRGAAENGKAMRFYEIPYNGCYMLSEYFDGLNTLEPKFEEGVHFDCFRNIEQLDYFIEVALSNEDRRKAIANNGLKFVNENYKSEHLALRVLNSAGIYI